MLKRITVIGFFVLASAIAGVSTGGFKLSTPTPRPTAPAPQGFCPPMWIC